MKTVTVVTQLQEDDHRFLKLKAVEMGMPLSVLTHLIIRLFISQEKNTPLALLEQVKRFHKEEMSKEEVKQTA